MGRLTNPAKKLAEGMLDRLDSDKSGLIRAELNKESFYINKTDTRKYRYVHSFENGLSNATIYENETTNKCKDCFN